jgi:hypothetical protein
MRRFVAPPSVTSEHFRATLRASERKGAIACHADDRRAGAIVQASFTFLWPWHYRLCKKGTRGAF